MRVSALDRELTRLAPVSDPAALDAVRARVMAQISVDEVTHAGAATRADVVPMSRARGHRRTAVRLGVAASLAAAGVAGITVWPAPDGSWVPAAYAAWRAVPELVTPADAQAQARTCLAKEAFIEAPDTTGPDLPLADMTPVVAERRGTWTYTLLVAGERGSHTESALTCLLSDDPQDGGMFGGSTGYAAGLPAPNQIEWIGADWATGDVFGIWGYTGDDVARVTATLWNEVVVDATVSNGYFAAWWPTPTNGETAEPLTLTWYLSDGTEGGTYDWSAP